MSCYHGTAVKWNPYNRVVQCHRCGWMPLRRLQLWVTGR